MSTNTTKKYQEDQFWTDTETGGLADMVTLDNGERVYGALYRPLIEVGILVPKSFEQGIIDLEDCHKLNLGITVTEEMLTRFTKWALKQHTESGLLAKIESGEGFDVVAKDNDDAQSIILDFLHTNGVREFNRDAGTGAVAMGNNIAFDMQFYDAQLPRVREYIHYRKFDVSGINVAARTSLWSHLGLKGIDKQLNHTALDDIKESVEEMNCYTKQMNELLWYKQQAQKAGIYSESDGKCPF